MIAIIVICLLAVIGTALTFYLWQRPSVGKPDTELTPPRFAGLFTSHDAAKQAESLSPDEDVLIRESLLNRARAGDLAALSESASQTEDGLYGVVLNALIASAAESQEKSRALVSYISTNSGLRANKRLVDLVMDKWKAGPDRRSTVEMVHLAALSDDAEVYSEVVELVVSFWQKGNLVEFRSEDLLELFESQFWMLAPEARRGGSAFALKQKLADVRRKLAATTPARP
jgi:hypothetical protein